MGARRAVRAHAGTNSGTIEPRPAQRWPPSRHVPRARVATVIGAWRRRRAHTGPDAARRGRLQVAEPARRGAWPGKAASQAETAGSPAWRRCVQTRARNFEQHVKAAWRTATAALGQAPPPGVRPRLAGSDPVRQAGPRSVRCQRSRVATRLTSASSGACAPGQGCQQRSGRALALGGARAGARQAQLARERAAAAARVRAGGLAERLVAAGLVEHVVDDLEEQARARRRRRAPSSIAALVRARDDRAAGGGRRRAARPS